MARTELGDVRGRILAAAEERLWKYGFRKTTIDEIAADAGVGKGTVYLHFDSKEDIAIAIIGQFKCTNLEQLEAIARDESLDPAEKLEKMLISPILFSHEICGRSPGAHEMIIAVRPHIRVRLKPYIEQEVALIAEVIEEGNQQRVFGVEDTMHSARTIKNLLIGFLPAYTAFTEIKELEEELKRAVSLILRGIRR